MHSISSHLNILQYFSFQFQPFLPAEADFFFGEVFVGEVDEEAVVACFRDHEAAVEFAEVFIIEAFAEEAEAFAAAGFDEREYEECVEEGVISGAAFDAVVHECVDVVVFSLFAEGESSFFEFSKYLAEMSPFFRHDRRQFLYKSFPVRVTLYEGDGGRSGFLFTVGMVCEYILQRDGCEVDPARICG